MGDNLLRTRSVHDQLLDWWSIQEELLFLAFDYICLAFLFFQVSGSLTRLLLLLDQILAENLIVVLLKHYEIHGLAEIIEVVILDTFLHLVAFQHHWILHFPSLIDGFEFFRFHDVEMLDFDLVALSSFNNRHGLPTTQIFHISWLLFFLWRLDLTVQLTFFQVWRDARLASWDGLLILGAAEFVSGDCRADSAFLRWRGGFRRHRSDCLAAS